MAAVRRILCATDLSPASEPAWAFARRLAAASRADVVLLSVLPPLPIPMEGFIDPATYDRLAAGGRAQAEADLQRFVQAAGTGAVRVTSRLVEGDPTTEILATGDREGADVIVVGTHGRAGLERLLLGSVAERVIHLAKRPVITVRPVPPSAAAPASGIRRLLYPTDFSATAQRAWPWARAVAEATGAEVDLLHVLLQVVPERDMDPVVVAQAAARLREQGQAEAALFVAAAGLPRERFAVHLVHGVEAEQIVHIAQARQVDLIVMGTHGRTGLLRLALGSVARRVLHAAPCPVMTVGPEVPAG